MGSTRPSSLNIVDILCKIGNLFAAFMLTFPVIMRPDVLIYASYKVYMNVDLHQFIGSVEPRLMLSL